MSKIGTVLWDIGGVLLTNGWDHKERAVVFAEFGIAGEDAAEFEARHPEANDLWEKGLLTMDEYLDRTLFFKPRDFGKPEFTGAVKAQSQWLKHSAIEVLKALAASQTVFIGALSNESRELNAYRFDTFGLRKYIRCFFSSCYLRMRKPHPEIYKTAVDILQADPATIVFIDDREKNAEAASEVGMHGICYTGPEQLTDSLKQLGIEISK